MGKSLKGKELGVGISQRKDGLYTGRYTDSNGKRKQKYFKKLQECRKWMADMEFQREHGTIKASGEMTVDAWFEYWISEIKAVNIKPATLISYKSMYKTHIKELIGNMQLLDVKPLHCQNVLNHMSAELKTSTVKDVRLLMHHIFEGALENELILKNPVTKSVKCLQGKTPTKRNALTVADQRKLMEVAQKSNYYNQYAFILQTGIRCGELIGLKWEDIDFDRKTLHVQRTMRYDNGVWQSGTPKSKSGNRIVPLTQEALSILMAQKEKNKSSKVIILEYSSFVFIGRTGKLIQNAAYDSALKILCRKAGINEISMHSLRHTFATRCIEGGMKPKTLQMLLGHSNLSMTMDLYVHTTEDEKIKELENIEDMLKVI